MPYLVIDEAGMGPAVLVRQVERIPRELNAAIGFSLDEEGVLLSYKPVSSISMFGGLQFAPATYGRAPRRGPGIRWGVPPS